MREYIDVIKRILELSETIEEAVEYITLQFNGSKFDEAYILEDIVNSLKEINASLEPMDEWLVENHDRGNTIDLIKDMNQLIQHCQVEAYHEAKLYCDTYLKSKCKVWRNDLNSLLNPYILS
jgi:hypothetical protein